MEDQLTSSQPQQPQESAHQTTSGVSTSKRKRPGKKAKFIKILLILIIILGVFGGGIWFLMREPEVVDDTTSNSQDLTSSEVEEPTNTPIPTERPIDKEEVSINILNGTGIPGEAGSLKETLENLDFTEIEVGNAETQDYVKTEVKFSKSLPESIIDEITSELEDIYADVRSSTSSSLEDYDVEIIIGYKLGHSPTATSAPATSTPTPTTGTTGTITPTVTETPTPTPQ